MTMPPALLIQKEPGNLQAQSLEQLITQGVAKGASRSPLFPTIAELGESTEGYVGMALAGGAAAIGTLLIAGLIRRANRK